jgi:hypothetical protein
MHANAKMIPGKWAMGESCGGGNSSMMYLIHCKNLCKFYNVPPTHTAQQFLKKKKENSREEQVLPGEGRWGKG